MICEACRAGRHDDCTLGDCDCQDRKEQETVERRLREIRATDERLATAVFTTLLYGGSDCAREFADHNDGADLCLLTAQIIATFRSMNC
jgi:hypothetical protein